ncbi:hypothetical protein HK101_008140 [Irineochytrium annulatum]|nr:hypothetical protein HK101_008140 [Irineochytrium annulatum]
MFLSSPNYALGRTASSVSLSSLTQGGSPIVSEDYLTADSLLRGARAVTLPASAGLPSAGGGMFKAVKAERERAERVTTRKKVPKTKRPVALFVKTARDAQGSWSSAKAGSAENVSPTTVVIPKTREKAPAAETSRPPKSKAAPVAREREEVSLPSHPADKAELREAFKKMNSHSAAPSVHSGKTVPNVPTAAGILSSLTKPVGVENIGAGLPQAGQDSSQRSWESMKTLLAGKIRRRSNSWLEMNREQSGSRRDDMYAIPGLSVSPVPSTPHAVGQASSRAASLESVTNQASLKKRLKAYAERLQKSQVMSQRYQIAAQLQDSLEAERRAKEAEKMSFLQQRAEIKFLNEVVGLIEEAKWERKRTELARSVHYGGPSKPPCEGMSKQFEALKRLPDIGLHGVIEEILRAIRYEDEEPQECHHGV